MNISEWYKIFTVNDSIKGRRLKVTSTQGVDNLLDPLTLSDNQGGRRIKVELDAYPSVSTYADLPPAVDYPNRIYAVLTSTGNRWLPAWLGGNFYPKGFYLSDGVSWNYMGEFPNQATQTQVDAGVLSDVFVSPLTLANASWLDEPYRYTTSSTNLQLNDGTLECKGTGIVVTLPLLSSITDYNIRTIINSSVLNSLVINTSGSDYINDVITFTLYPLESLSLQKGNNTWIVN